MGIKSFPGYAAAGLVLAAMVLAPFALLSRFTGLVGNLGLRSHPKFTGGPVLRILDRGGYQVAISAPAGPVGPLEWGPRFVQVSWSPASALPGLVEEQLDLEGSGHPQVRVAFQVPADPALSLTGRMEVLDPARVAPATILSRNGPELLVRLDQRIVARFRMN
jgi:hypothetical protein